MSTERPVALGLGAVDLSPAAIAWAKDRARNADAQVHFHCGDAFTLTATDLTGPYDLIYDSGCLHHLPPHRRISYLALLDRSLAPSGHLALACFAAGEMGSELPDANFYHHSHLNDGLAYTPESLRWIFSHLTEVELRHMHDQPPSPPASANLSSGQPRSATTPTPSLRKTPQALVPRLCCAVVLVAMTAGSPGSARRTSM